MNFLKSLSAGSLLAASAMAFAQQPATRAQQPQAPATQLTPEQQEQLNRQNVEISKAAAEVVQLIDRGKLAEAWTGASPSAQALVKTENFVQSVSSDRKRVGAPTERKLAGINRVAYKPGGQVPPGNYINVAYATRFANQPQPVRELVSFHLDDDRVWRLSGYSVR